MNLRIALVTIAVLAVGAPAPASQSAPIPAKGTASFSWRPEASPDGPVQISISRSAQRLAVYRNGVRIGGSDVSTGRPGYRTPTRTFAILEKKVVHYSSTYGNAPMPFMQRLTPRGVALHAGTLPGHPASHGCIRLPSGFAPLLYGVTRIGTPVTITDASDLGVLAPALGAELAMAPRTGFWRSERSSLRPVSIVASLPSRTMVVIGAGQLIGSAPLILPTPAEGIYQNPALQEKPPVVLPQEWVRGLGDNSRQVVLVTAEPLTTGRLSARDRAVRAQGCA